MTMVISVKDRNAVKYAANVLKQGGVVIYPTESSYGIGADFTNKTAVRKIYRIKGRTKNKQLSVIVGSIAAIKKYAFVNKETSLLAKKFMPGPLTLIVKAKQRGTIAFRIPSNKFALKMAKHYKKPITATSANISGKEPLYKIKDVIRTFGGSVDLIIDAGNLPRRKPSTIYCLPKRKILRGGPVSEKKIMETIISRSRSGRISTL